MQRVSLLLLTFFVRFEHRTHLSYRPTCHAPALNIFLQVVSVEQGVEMASRNNARHLQASARTGMNIEAAFQTLVEDILATQAFDVAAGEKRSSARRRRSSAIGF